jgi:hypothetical protein
MNVAAGSAKSFIELLNVWVVERKGRKIRLKLGDVEIAIQGGISRGEIEKAACLLERISPSQSKIIRP